MRNLIYLICLQQQEPPSTLNYIRIHMWDPFLGVVQHWSNKISRLTTDSWDIFSPFLGTSRKRMTTLSISHKYMKNYWNTGSVFWEQLKIHSTGLRGKLTGPGNTYHTQKGQLLSQREEDIMQTGEIWLLLWVKPQKTMWSFSFLPLPLILPTHILCNPSMTATNRKQLSITRGPLRRNLCKTLDIKKVAGWLAGNSC